MDWTTGLDYWTVWERHNDPAEFVFRVMEPKFNFLGLEARFLCSHMNIGDFDDHENLNTHPCYNACLLFQQLYHFIAMFCVSFTCSIQVTII